MDLQRLLYLCQVKNDLNRKRRRFHYYMQGGRREWDSITKTMKSNGTKHISPMAAEVGYRKAQTQMRRMTGEMRAMRVALGASFEWNESGMIYAVKVGDKRIKNTEFKKYYDAESFEIEFFKRGR